MKINDYLSANLITNMIYDHDILIPLDDESVDLIYSSHLIAYFDREEIDDVLEEWYRVLKPGGILRLATPDFRKLSRLYVEGQITLDQILGPLYGKWDLNGKIYHKTTYTFCTLKDVLEKNNFKDVKLYNWRNTDHAKFDDHSQAYIPHMDKENGVLISLNVECKK